tara:strand:- start:257 stop:607 length:351 start_codon:yes stop_codon:yes gene_type:complete
MAVMLYKSVDMNGVKFRPKIQTTGIESGYYKNGYKVEYDDAAHFTITIYTHAHNMVVESIKFTMYNNNLHGYYNYLLPGSLTTHEFIKKDEITQEFKDYWSSSFVLPEHHEYFTFN